MNHRLNKTKQELIDAGFYPIVRDLLGKIDGEDVMIFQSINFEQTMFTLLYHGNKQYVKDYFPEQSSQRPQTDGNIFRTKMDDFGFD